MNLWNEEIFSIWNSKVTPDILNKIKCLILDIPQNHEELNFIWQKKTRISYTVIVWYGYSQGDKEALFPDLFFIFYWLELDVSLSKFFSRDSFLS